MRPDPVGGPTGGIGVPSGRILEFLTIILLYAAGVAGSGALWYFLARGNRRGVAISLLIASLSLLGVVGLHLHSGALRRRSRGRSSAFELLSFVWKYPTLGGNECSWAVKESEVLFGNVGSARDHPALGVAIITTELALLAFGKNSLTRIEMCIEWALRRTDPRPPHSFLIEVREPSDFEVETVRPDFRHTVALGIILARARRKDAYVECYLRLLLREQLPDGSWPTESSRTISPLYTMSYGIELLALSRWAEEIDEGIRRSIPLAMRRAVNALANLRRDDNLWSSSVMKAFPWDGALGTSWLLHRLAHTLVSVDDSWKDILRGALLRMVEVAADHDTWRDTPDDQRRRVEARIAAAASRANRALDLDEHERRFVLNYLRRAKAHLKDWLVGLEPALLDVSTATFLVWTLARPEDFRALGRAVLSTSSQ